MSKILGYIKLIPKGIKNADKIAEGVVNYVKLNYGTLPQDEQDEIARRRVICLHCPFNSVNAKESEEYFNIFGKYYETERNEVHCSICGCELNLKTSSLGADCGIKSDEKTKHLDFKWIKYK